MRLSYSTLAMLDQAGDEAAHTILVAWGGICGILWETDHVQAHYRAKLDYLVLRIQLPYEEQHVVAPYQWESFPQSLILQHPIISDTTWYQKGR